jgi:hypothetical protein
MSSKPTKRTHDEAEEDDENDDAVVIVSESSSKDKPEKTKKPAKKKAKASASAGDDDKEDKSKEKKEKKAKPAAKPLTAKEKETTVAKGASMARNRAIASFLKTFVDSYKEAKEWIKAASAQKAVKAILALTEPIVIARQLSALDGCGKGTIEKVEKFLEENPEAGEESKAAQAHSEFAYLKDLDRDIIISMLQNGDVTHDAVKSQRDDINADDF